MSTLESPAGATSVAEQLTGPLFDGAPCGMLLFGPQGRLLKVNQTLQRWLGRDVSPARAHGEPAGFLDHLDAPAFGKLQHQVDMVMQGLTPPPLDIELRRDDGTTMAVQASASAIHSAHGEFIAGLTTLHDMSARIGLEARLHGQVGLVRSIIDRTPSQLAYFDLDLCCRFGNQAFCDRLGLGRGELDGRPFQDCFAQVDLPTTLPRFMRALGGEKQAYVSEHRVPGGELVYTESLFIPDVQDDMVRGVFIEIQDITERRRAEDIVLHANLELEERVDRRTNELRQAKRRFGLMIDALQDSCIYFMDATGRITEWSESAHRLHGFSREQVSRMNFADLAAPRAGEEDEISIRDTIRLAIDRGQWETRGWRQRAGGDAFWGQTLITALRGEDDELEGLSCITRDMTAMKDLDRVMNDLNAELDRRVTERVRQYTVPNKDLDIFTHSITHDLRGPMRHINTFAGLIAEGLGDDASEELRHFRESLKRASLRLNGMIESLLTYSRIGRIDLHPATLPMDNMLEGVIARLKTAHPDRDIQWVVQDDMPVAFADPMMIADLFTRLLDNAVKFTRKVERAEIQIGCRTENDGSSLFFIVDNGAGFDVAKAHNLFLMFQRQHHSLDFEGHGAGLALCQRIVQRHNGRIWLDSTPGHGCAVYFTLPVDLTLTTSRLAALGL